MKALIVILAMLSLSSCMGDTNIKEFNDSDITLENHSKVMDLVDCTNVMNVVVIDNKIYAVKEGEIAYAVLKVPVPLMFWALVIGLIGGFVIGFKFD